MDNLAMQNLLAGNRYLLLQGPMGPFFTQLAKWLRTTDRMAMQACFNHGDYFYADTKHALIYADPPELFPQWLSEQLRTYQFDTVVCFGDCRFLHQQAKKWAEQQGVRFLVFEEGYIRPFYITLEQGGVNGYSQVPRIADYYRSDSLPILAKPIGYHPSFALRVFHATLYYLAGRWGRRDYPHYQHHKVFCPWKEAISWTRAARRKIMYRFAQRHILPQLTGKLSGQYYLAVLQVYNDSQIVHHSQYNDVREFIDEVIRSFAQGAVEQDYLVIKHHPMDRGHRFYGRLIAELTARYHLSGRVFYVHDLPMPTLLSHTKGVVTINSTAGISALTHRKPTKVMGRALYDIEGLTYQGGLDQFWTADYIPDTHLFKCFKTHLLNMTQINGVFYSCDGWQFKNTISIRTSEAKVAYDFSDEAEER